MTYKRKSQLEILVEKLDRELLIRGAQVPEERRFQVTLSSVNPQRDAVMSQMKELYNRVTTLPVNPALSHISTENLVKMLLIKTQELKVERGIWGRDDRLDFYQIQDHHIKQSAAGVAAIFRKNDLIEENNISTLRIKNYKEAYDLCDCEPFCRQPIATGRVCTGFLVKDDVIATAGHCTDKVKVTDLRFIFGFKMVDADTPVTEISNGDIYKGVEIIARRCNRFGNQSDWALIKLNRHVTGQRVVTLSATDVACDQPIYIIGHPLGLPLKFSAGAQIRDMSDSYFAADLSVYSGNSGSPVFNAQSHEVVGIVVRGDNRDFRWTETGWLSMIYPNPDGYDNAPQCTRVSEFVHFLF